MKPCACCEKLFEPPSKHPAQRFCSIACRGRACRTRIPESCAWCGEAVLRYASRRKKLAHAFCNHTCLHHWLLNNRPRGETHAQYQTPIVLACVLCGTSMTKPPSQVSPRNFCSRDCQIRWQRLSGHMAGTNNPNWRGGEADYRGPNWQRQRLLALQRDDFTCQACAARAQLQVHHLIPFVCFTDYHRANVLANLQTLCMSCHKKADYAYIAAHPDMRRHYPDMCQQRIHTCRTCQQRYVARTVHSRDCDACSSRARKSRARRRAPSSQKTSLFSRVPLGEDRALAATLELDHHKPS
jgi:HNH endonuclease